jgi:hypothetical protein
LWADWGLVGGVGGVAGTEVVEVAEVAGSGVEAEGADSEADGDRGYGIWSHAWSLEFTYMAFFNKNRYLKREGMGNSRRVDERLWFREMCSGYVRQKIKHGVDIVLTCSTNKGVCLVYCSFHMQVMTRDGICPLTPYISPAFHLITALQIMLRWPRSHREP